MGEHLASTESEQLERDLVWSLKAMDFGAMDSEAQIVALRVLLSGLTEVQVSYGRSGTVNFMHFEDDGIIVVSYEPSLMGVLWFHYPDQYASRYTREQLCGTFWGRFKASIKEDRRNNFLWFRFLMLFFIVATASVVVHTIASCIIKALQS